MIVSAYHPQINGMIERGHKPLTDALSKLTNEHQTDWIQHLPAALWADRSTVRVSHERISYFMFCGSEPVFSIELNYPIWKILPWKKMKNISDLIVLRARQLKRRDEDLTETTDMMRRMREIGKEVFDTNSNSYRIFDFFQQFNFFFLFSFGHSESSIFSNSLHLPYFIFFFFF